MRESYIWRARRYFWHGTRKLVMVTWAILSTLMEKYLRVRELRAPRAYTISFVADSWSYMRDGWIDYIWWLISIIDHPHLAAKLWSIHRELSNLPDMHENATRDRDAIDYCHRRDIPILADDWICRRDVILIICLVFAHAIMNMSRVVALVRWLLINRIFACQYMSGIIWNYALHYLDDRDS